MIYLTVIAALEAAALVIVALVFLQRLGEQDERAARERQDFPARLLELEAAWRDERRELLTRIQRPEHVPVTAPVDFVIPESEPDEIGLVGTIAEPGLEE